MINFTLRCLCLAAAVAQVVFSFQHSASAADLTDYGATPPISQPATDANAAKQKLNFHTDLFTGSFGYQIPIVVPPARQGFVPKITLQYNSSGKNGWCGVGWDLDMGSIQRDAKFGAPLSGGKAAGWTAYTFSFGGYSGRLVYSGSGGNYHPEVNKDFVKFSLSGGIWTATDKSGTQYTFGGSGAELTSSPGGTFKWALTSIRDANGNRISITYTYLSGQLYLNQINYNGNNNSPTINNTCSVVFGLSARTDTLSSLIFGSEIQTIRRLDNIRVYAQGQLVRRYALAYTYSGSTGASLLQNVTEFDSGTIALPSQSFSYSIQQKSFQSAVNWSMTPRSGDTQGASPGAPCAQLADMNGDGLPDWVICPPSSPYNHFKVQLNTGSGFSASQTSWSGVANENNNSGIYYNALDNAYATFLDINGDMLPDRVMQQQTPPRTLFKVQINNGSSFGSLDNLTGVDGPTGDYQGYSYNSSQVNVPQLSSPNGIDTIATLVDMNGDGWADRVMRGTSSGVLSVQLNNGSSFGNMTSWNGADADLRGAGTGFSPRARNYYDVLSELSDMNGDGLLDRLIQGKVQLNNGNSFSVNTSWGLGSSEDPADFVVTDGNYTKQTMDMNGDGLPDLVTSSGGSTLSVRFNTGRNFDSTSHIWSGVDTLGDGTSGWDNLQAWNLAGTKVVFMDMNGDGLVDRVKRDHASNPAGLRVQLNSGPIPDLLTTVNNGLGGSLIITYKSSREYNNMNGSQPLLPFSVQTVSSVVANDGNGNIGTTSYTYEGGFYDKTAKEFRGFGYAEETGPTNLKTKYYFHQGGGRNNSANGEFQDTKSKSGMICNMISYGSDGAKYSETINKVEEVTLVSSGDNSSYFPYIKQTIKRDYEGLTTPRETVAQYDYQVTTGNLTASTGNLLKETNLGEVTGSTYSHTFTDITDACGPVYKNYTYATIVSNPDIRNKPQRVTVSSDAAGVSVLRETLYEYYATTGNLYKQRDRICPGTYADTIYQYDQYGNPTTITDPVGIVTTTDYDTATATYPWRKYTGTLSDNLIEYMLHDSRSGAVLESTNIQGMVTKVIYDTFFRPTETRISTAPNTTPTLWTTRIYYSLGTGVANHWVKTVKRDPMDLATGLETYTYYDAFGKLVQTRSESETAGSFRVNQLIYNKLGQLVFITNPYFGTGTAYVAPTGIIQGQYTEYDALSRAFRVSPCANRNFAFGTVAVLTGDTDSLVGQTTTAFKDGTNPWATVITDARGKVRKSFNDAFGNTTQIVEVTSGGNYNTLFAYDLLGNLTNITDHALNKTALFYDELGRKVAMADPNTGYWQYRLDVSGRLVEQTDAMGQKTKLYYNDPAGRVTRKEGLNTAGTVVSVATYLYDGNGGDTAYTVYPGQLFKVTDDEGWTKTGFDVRGRILVSSRYLTKNSQTYTTTSTFDDADRVETMTYPGVSAPTIRYTYDTGGNLNEVKRDDAGGAAVTYYSPKGFDEFGRLEGINYGNGVGTDFSYYPVSQRHKDIVTKLANNTQIQNVLNGYDQVGNITKITDSVAAHTGAASATITSASYDDLNRLTAATWAGYGTKSYSYDAIGNTLVNGEAGSGTYNYGSARPQAVKSANGVTYTYDLNGNMRLRGQQKLEYDVFNHLKKVTSTTANVAEFGYGIGGERLWKTSNGQLTQVWVGSHYEEKEGKVLYHVMGAGRRICTFESVAAGTSGYNPLLHEFYYYHSDYLGSSSIVTERNGTEVQHYEYSAYGRDRHTASSSAFPVSRRFTGQILDTDTGLYYYNARYYDPELGRFIQPDSIIPDFVNPQSYNRYAYVLNNPLRFVDPDGRAAAPWYSYIPGIGPGIAEYQGNQALNAMAISMGERKGTGWQSYHEMRAELFPESATAGNVSGVAGVGKIAGGATELYTSTAQEIATGGLAGPVTKVAADKMGEVPGIFSNLRAKVSGLFSKGTDNIVTAAPAGLADDLLKYAGNVNPKAGFTDLFIHSDAKGFAVLHNGKWVGLTHRDVANFAKSKGIDGNIRLISCEAGQAQLAQDLANKLGVSVEAATTKVGIYKNKVGDPVVLNDGTWETFTPTKK